MEKCPYKLQCAQFSFEKPGTLSAIGLEVVFLKVIVGGVEIWQVRINKILKGKRSFLHVYNTKEEPMQNSAEFFLKIWLEGQQSPDDGA